MDRSLIFASNAAGTVILNACQICATIKNSTTEWTAIATSCLPEYRYTINKPKNQH
jgi:hypothetical protein